MIDTSVNLVISKSNEVFLKIDTEPHIEYELRDHFTFEVEGAKAMAELVRYVGCICVCNETCSLLVSCVHACIAGGLIGGDVAVGGHGTVELIYRYGTL